MFGYAAFGLTLGSDISLPGFRLATSPDFRAGTVPADHRELRIRVAARSGAPATATLSVDIGRDAVVFQHADIGRVTVRGGNEIDVAPHARADDETLRSFIAGPALAVALHQLGHLVLHASAVAVRGRAVALLGDKGAGKSSLTATLLARGHALVSDDIVVVRRGRDGEEVVQGNRTLKVEPDVVRALGRDPDQLKRIHPAGSKRQWPVADDAQTEATPLARLLAIRRGDVLRLEPIAPSAAFIEVVRHTYGARFDMVEKAGLAARHFQQVSELVRAVPAAQVTRSDDLALLHELAERVEAWLGEAGA